MDYRLHKTVVIEPLTEEEQEEAFDILEYPEDLSDPCSVPFGCSVNHPPHYTSHPSGVECIEITEHMNFCLGNAVKYVWRAGLKTDDPLKDLKKAVWYINREIARLEQQGG